MNIFRIQKNWINFIACYKPNLGIGMDVDIQEWTWIYKNGPWYTRIDLDIQEWTWIYKNGPGYTRMELDIHESFWKDDFFPWLLNTLNVIDLQSKFNLRETFFSQSSSDWQSPSNTSWKYKILFHIDPYYPLYYIHIMHIRYHTYSQWLKEGYVKINW